MWKMYFDGVINIHGNEVGAVLVSPYSKQFPVVVKLVFDYTNNMAEYEAYITGLKVVISLSVRYLDAYGNLALIIYQVNGEWRVKEHRLMTYYEHLINLAKEFEEITFNYLTRNKNQFVNALAILAAMTKLDLEVEVAFTNCC